ncbi:5-methylcytosine restriction system specificity protein McrC [Mycoplasma sp. Z463D]
MDWKNTNWNKLFPNKKHDFKNIKSTVKHVVIDNKELNLLWIKFDIASPYYYEQYFATSHHKSDSENEEDSYFPDEFKNWICLIFREILPSDKTYDCDYKPYHKTVLNKLNLIILDYLHNFKGSKYSEIIDNLQIKLECLYNLIKNNKEEKIINNLIPLDDKMFESIYGQAEAWRLKFIHEYYKVLLDDAIKSNHLEFYIPICFAFEIFIYNILLNLNSEKRTFKRINYQYKIHNIISKRKNSDLANNFSLNPDIIVKNGKTLESIIEIKNKKVINQEGKIQIDNADIYQLLTYAQALKVKNAFLIYPSDCDKIKFESITYKPRKKHWFSRSSKVTIQIILLPFYLNDLSTSNLSQIKDILYEKILK